MSLIFLKSIPATSLLVSCQVQDNNNRCLQWREENSILFHCCTAQDRIQADPQA